jgi:hypothetical protein
LSNWLLLHYKLPPEPTASRVYVWRKLKRLNAILWQDAVWVLPVTARTQEQFQWLAAEIVELGGEAALWTAQTHWAGQEEALIAQFTRQVESLYQMIVDGLAAAEPDLAALSRQFQQAQTTDYFSSPLGEQAREALLLAREGKRK